MLENYTEDEYGKIGVEALKLEWGIDDRMPDSFIHSLLIWNPSKDIFRKHFKWYQTQRQLQWYFNATRFTKKDPLRQICRMPVGNQDSVSVFCDDELFDFIGKNIGELNRKYENSLNKKPVGNPMTLAEYQKYHCKKDGSLATNKISRW